MVVQLSFGDGSLACVKDEESISILGCLKLDRVLYVDGLKVNLLSISKIFDNEHTVNFCQDLCKVINKEGKIIIIGHRTVDNCCAMNLNSKTPLVQQAKELWHRRLGHINYRDLIHLVNNKKVIGIPKLSGELKPICGECMKGKQTQSSHKKVKEIKTTRPLDL